MMVEAVTLPPRQRIAARLVALASELSPRGTATIALSQQLLGEMTGLTRKTVNAHLAALEAAGLIAILYGGVRVRSMQGLREAACT